MPVLAQLSHQVKWEPLVLSDINLSSFLAWAEKSETSELVAVLSLVNLGIHRGCGESPSVQVRSKEAILAQDCLTTALVRIACYCGRGMSDLCPTCQLWLAAARQPDCVGCAYYAPRLGALAASATYLPAAGEDAAQEQHEARPLSCSHRRSHSRHSRARLRSRSVPALRGHRQRSRSWRRHSRSGSRSRARSRSGSELYLSPTCKSGAMPKPRGGSSPRDLQAELRDMAARAEAERKQMMDKALQIKESAATTGGRPAEPARASKEAADEEDDGGATGDRRRYRRSPRPPSRSPTARRSRDHRPDKAQQIKTSAATTGGRPAEHARAYGKAADEEDDGDATRDMRRSRRSPRQPSRSPPARRSRDHRPHPQNMEAEDGPGEGSKGAGKTSRRQQKNQSWQDKQNSRMETQKSGKRKK